MICPNLKCGRTVVAPESARGKVVRCAHCHSPFIVPRLPVPEPASAPPPEPEGGGEKDKAAP